MSEDSPCGFVFSLASRDEPVNDAADGNCGGLDGTGGLGKFFAGVDDGNGGGCRDDFGNDDGGVVEDKVEGVGVDC